MNKFLPLIIAFFLFSHMAPCQSIFLDPTFGNGGIALAPGLNLNSGSITNMAIQPDGKMLILSRRSISPGSNQITMAVHRFLTDGSLDTSFGLGGTAEINTARNRFNFGNDLELLPNGKILFGFYALTIGVDTIYTTIVQLNPDGSDDAAFGTNGRVTIIEIVPAFGDAPFLADVEVQSNGRIVLVYASHGSQYSEYGFRLLSPNGAIIPGYQDINWWYTADLDEFYTQAVIQPDDKILIGGILSPTNGLSPTKQDFLLERFEPSTFSDDNFGAGGYVVTDNNSAYDRMYDLFLEPDGSILTSGTSDPANLMIAKYQSDGTPDTTFGIHGRIVYPNLIGVDFSSVMARASDGRFVVIGRKFPYTLDGQEAAIVRFLPDGAIDTTFSPDGLVYMPQSEINQYTDFHDVAILPDHRILACGVSYASDTLFMLVRLLPDVNAVVWYHDVDGDGYGNALDSVFAAQMPMGYVANNTDCDDSMASVNPGAVEICGNGIDDNCDGISLQDTIPPVAICVASVKLPLDSMGIALLNPQDLDNGSHDDCGNVVFSVDKSEFGCADFGVNTITLTVSDNAGLANTCQAIVKISDQIGPIALCKPSVKLFLDAWGNASLSAADLDNGSYDNCAIATFRIDTTAFDCQNLGVQTLTLHLEDIYGNLSACESIIKVSDEMPPVPVCYASVTLALSNQGTVTLDSAILANIDQGSYDNCSDVLSLSVDKNVFDCSNLGLNNIILSFEDGSGNINTCSVALLISDKVDPVAVCVETLVLEIDDTGLLNLDAAQIDDGSFDNCNYVSFQVTPAQFTMANLGWNNVVLTVSDSSGNETTCSATVEIVDKVTSVSNPDAAIGATVYPNPSTGKFELRITEGLMCQKAAIFNAAGQLVWADATPASRFDFDLTGEASGCYYLRVQTEKGGLVMRLVVL